MPSLDIILFVAFLGGTLLIGLIGSRHVKTLQAYAIGNKEFSTAEIVATIVATWIGGGFLTYNLQGVYTKGLSYMIVMLGGPLGLLLVGQVLSVRMGEFLHNMSIAEAMGDLYGTVIRIITAISGILRAIGVVAIQFKVIDKTLSMLLGVEGIEVSITAASIVIIYSSLGGIRAITLTDLLQFITISIFIPIIALIIWNNLQEPSQVVHTLNTNPIFSFRQTVGMNHNFFSTLALMLTFMVPGMHPANFQRIAMARDIQQIKASSNYSAIIILFTSIILAWIAILLLTDNPSINPNNLLNYLIGKYAYQGLKGFIAIGITAMAMSTADSHLNASSVLIVHDMIKLIRPNLQEKETVLTLRFFSFVIGLLSLVLALFVKDLMSLNLLGASFYQPIVTIPFLLAIFGFRSRARAVIVGMVAGLMTVILWDKYFAYTGINRILPGMIANLIAFMASHYFLREPGGWTGIKDLAPLLAARQARKDAWGQFASNLKANKVYEYLQKNLPARDVIYSLFGIYVMGATYALFFTIPQETVLHYKSLYDFITYSVLFVAATFIIYPVWPPTFKARWFITFVWPVGICYILFVVGMMLVMMSDFHQIQVMVFLFNLVMAALLLSWPLMVFLAGVGVLVGYLVFNTYYGSIHLESIVDSGEFKLFYCTLLFSSLLMILFRFKQKESDLEERNEYLAASYEKCSEELSEALIYREEVLKDLKEDEIKLVDQSVAAYIRQIIYRTVDYLRLEVTKIDLDQLVTDVKQLVKLKRLTPSPQIVVKKNIQENTIRADVEKIKQLLVNSISYIQQNNPTNKPILVTLDKAVLGHRISEIEDYIRKLNALKITLTTEKSLPPTQEIYMLDQVNLISKTNKHIDRKQLIENARIIDAHYGYADFAQINTHVYVIPVNVREVRGKVMELLREPAQADPEEIKHPMAIKIEQELLNRLKATKNVDIKVIEKALDTIKKYHAGVKRKSGEPFFTHPINVALILLDYCKDQDAIISALLHDSIEDTSLSLPQLQARFGKTVAMIVEKLTNLEDKPRKFSLDNHEYIARLTKTEDKRIAYVKLADRLHNMRTIQGHSDVNKQRKIAEETFQLFVPMAKQLGLTAVEKELEERSLEVLSKKI